MSIMGTRVLRTEDPKLLTVGGGYVEDLQVPELTGAAYVTFVRSPVAHARILGVERPAPGEVPGLVGVFTADDFDDVPEPDSSNPFAEPLLARDVVRFVGEPVAIVVTDELYQGEDAAELVSVDYEQLPAVVTIDDALADETVLFAGAGSNVVKPLDGDLDDSIFDACEAVVEATIVNQRVAPAPMETRAAAAAWDGERLTHWVSTQNAQSSKDAVVGALGLAPTAVRVIAPDVGGGFGAKIGIDRDAIVVAWAARRIGRAVRWAESRNENMISMTHGRDQRHRIKIGGTRDGRVLAYRLEVIQNCGAYLRFGPALPMLTTLMACGVYDFPAVQAVYGNVVTNTTPIAAYRGAGRPEAAATVERAMDLFAAEIGMDPGDVRRRNFIAADAFPFTTKTGATYDSGEYEKALDRVEDAAGYRALRAEQERRRAAGDALQLGIGLAVYVEITAGDGGGENARVMVDGDGMATVYSGSSPQGQGHDTAWAMLVSDELGIPMEKITVVHGDTDAVPVGVGTYGSRSMQLGGTAVHQAAVMVKDQVRKLAAEELEADPDDIEIDAAGAVWQVRGVPGTGVTWAELADRAGEAGLSADVHFKMDSPTFPFGAHCAVVEVDVETGKVRLVRHVALDDAGKIVNPVLAEGQRHGGIAQGAAQALLEWVRYDDVGNPVTATFADYSIVSAAELPSFELVAMETPTGLNPLGVKGIGEAGTIGATPAVQNAVVDALSHLGVRHVEMPVTPQRVWAAINEVGA
jgi:carbon-monoxide dehydrogenase large subunit